MERPEEVNAYLKDWLARIFPPSAGIIKKARDEL